MFQGRIKTFLLASAAAFFIHSASLYSQTVLTADGQTDAYTRIKGVLGASPETPDCSHPQFGPHITQAVDDDLKKYVFVFNIHVTPDNDRCVNFDRQRLEIKTEGSSPDYVKGFLNDTVTFRWKFKLPSGFQPSTSFTHIHQIKAFDGDDGAPIITLTPRKASPNSLQLIHIDSTGTTTFLTSTDLAPFVGIWVEAYEKITYNTHGKYSLVLNRLSDGAQLFSYSNDDIDMCRNGTTVVRPKWGIYRSLDHPDQLRDEQVLFDHFCLAKGTDDCVSDRTQPDLAVSAQTLLDKTPAGGKALYGVLVTPVHGFTGDVNLYANGLPAKTTATFNPAVIQHGAGYSVLTVATTDASTPGTYPLTINGVSGVLSHTATESLSVSDFSLAATPASATVTAGFPVSYNATVAPLSGWDESVIFNVSGLPSGAFAYFTPAVLPGASGTSVLHIITTLQTPAGTYNLQISAGSWFLTHTQAVTLAVNPPLQATKQ
jgi:hypothetical protein